MRVVQITGQRNWDRIDIMRDVLAQVKPDVVIHGAARGADNMSGFVAREMGIPTLIFPAKWDLHGRAAGPIRNTHMCGVSVDLRDNGDEVIVLAFIDEAVYGPSKGTADMIRTCVGAGLDVRLVDTQY